MNHEEQLGVIAILVIIAAAFVFLVSGATVMFQGV